jgi:biopolymer transport protein ExbB
MSTTASQKKSSGEGLKNLFAGASMVFALLLGILIYVFILGDPKNFEGGDPVKGHPLNFLGIIHKGGVVVPMLLAINLIVIIFSIERIITIGKANGKGNISAFVKKIQALLGDNRLDEAINACDQQRGSLANVVRAGLHRYKLVTKDATMDNDSKAAAIQKELEEATTLELPMLSKNLVIISTCASIGTLVGLIGTVFGMIKAFSALASQGSPDTVALATGISEALINTAFGIIASTLAIVAYNYFSNKIDGMTYSMDEASFTIVQNFHAKH